jgi:hypothetical protein
MLRPRLALALLLLRRARMSLADIYFFFHPRDQLANYNTKGAKKRNNYATRRRQCDMMTN